MPGGSRSSHVGCWGGRRPRAVVFPAPLGGCARRINNPGALLGHGHQVPCGAGACGRGVRARMGVGGGGAPAHWLCGRVRVVAPLLCASEGGRRMASTLFPVACCDYQASSQRRDGGGRWIRGAGARSGGTTPSLLPLVASLLSPRLGCPAGRIASFGLVAVATSSGSAGAAGGGLTASAGGGGVALFSAAGARRGGSRAGRRASSSWCWGSGVWDGSGPLVAGSSLGSWWWRLRRRRR